MDIRYFELRAANKDCKEKFSDVAKKKYAGVLYLLSIEVHNTVNIIKISQSGISNTSIDDCLHLLCQQRFLVICKNRNCSILKH